MSITNIQPNQKWLSHLAKDYYPNVSTPNKSKLDKVNVFTEESQMLMCMQRLDKNVEKKNIYTKW